MPFKKKEEKIEKEVKVVEKYEYLLVEYIKEISNEMTYLVLIVASLFFYVLLDFFPTIEDAGMASILKIIFVLIIIGGFGFFGMSNITKRRIEKQFEKILF